MTAIRHGAIRVTATQPITHAQLGQLLANLRFGIDPSDLHGSLTGYLCAGGRADARGWLAALELKPDDSAAAAKADTTVLQQLFRECSAWLSDPDLHFEPLRLWALVEYRDGSRRFEGVVRHEDWLDEPGGAEFPESRASWAAAVGYAPPVDFPARRAHPAMPDRIEVAA